MVESSVRNHDYAGAVLHPRRNRSFGGLRCDHSPDLAIAGQGLLKQVKALGHRPPVIRQRASRNGPAHLLEQWVLFADKRLGHALGAVHYNVCITHMRRRLIRLAVSLVILAAVAAAGAIVSIARDIRRQSIVDEAQPADVILVLGAAEYRGRPSPVLEARLNHALFLYRKGLAPRILTTGGKGGDPMFTEGEVGRAYLSRHGIPSEAILVESEGESTVYSTAAAAEIMRRMSLQSCIIVSDGYHIYRVKKMLQSQGMSVYGSPRPAEPHGGWREEWRYVRQAIAYGLWRIGIPL